ncbi:hypothetical protein EV424DRAFT_1545973 [Suillus variegatus]|nr:hypothetical protein EV424DRAFT_1545973 [Suillus variegatus]
MSLTCSQLEALEKVQQILDSAGLSPISVTSSVVSSPSSHQNTPDVDSTLDTISTPPYPRYQSPAPYYFTTEEISRRANYVNRATKVSAIVDHPVHAILEYPITAPGSIAHHFVVDPISFVQPQSAFQYSLGGGHGGRENAVCLLLRDDAGKGVRCRQLKSSCNGLKAGYSDDSAEAEVFNKTLAFFCAVSEWGCGFDANLDLSPEIVLDSFDLHSESESRGCGAPLMLSVNNLGRPYIHCKNFNASVSRARTHLVLRNLDEFNTDYLRALIENDLKAISFYETRAKNDGYGPLMPCTFVASPAEQKQCCRKLARGTLRSWPVPCKAKFDIYTPYNLTACPQVLVICTNNHSHPPPAPVKTPEAIKAIFYELLLTLSWKLADATPRRILLDSAFIQALQAHLSWKETRNPTLSDLHPSLGNSDHARRLINTLRFNEFPSGTGFAGAIHLATKHDLLPIDERYIRCAESHQLSTKSASNPPAATTSTSISSLRLVICMTKRMSWRLMQAKRLSIDTSFKRVHGWQEFEFESWDVAHMKSVIGARAFTTSQSAQAHFILFQRIFEIASADTGCAVQFQYMHGEGIQTIIADGHKGQGLGLGMYCVYLCKDSIQACRYDTTALLRDLDPYDHLRRFYRLCLAHYKRNIRSLRGQIPKDVEIAMLTIASAEPHPDLQGTLKKIKKGGKKAAAWLKDKIEGTKFALPALYQPNSLIPLEIWKASPTTTNGNEQAHRNINRDGVGLTLLGGIMRGFHYDTNISASLDLFDAFGINSSDRLSTHAYRAKRALARQVRYTRSSPSEGNTSFACVHLTPPPVEPQPELIPNSSLMTGSTGGAIPVSTFSTLTYALTAGAHVMDHRARSPSFSAAPPTVCAVHHHIYPTQDQLSTFSTLQGAVE